MCVLVLAFQLGKHSTISVRPTDFNWFSSPFPTVAVQMYSVTKPAHTLSLIALAGSGICPRASPFSPLPAQASTCKRKNLHFREAFPWFEGFSPGLLLEVRLCTHTGRGNHWEITFQGTFVNCSNVKPSSLQSHKRLMFHHHPECPDLLAPW